MVGVRVGVNVGVLVGGVPVTVGVGVPREQEGNLNEPILVCHVSKMGVVP
jgi:hypothetical protein